MQIFGRTGSYFGFDSCIFNRYSSCGTDWGFCSQNIICCKKNAFCGALYRLLFPPVYRTCKLSFYHHCIIWIECLFFLQCWKKFHISVHKYKKNQKFNCKYYTFYIIFGSKAFMICSLLFLLVLNFCMPYHFFFYIYSRNLSMCQFRDIHNLHICFDGRMDKKS